MLRRLRAVFVGALCSLGTIPPANAESEATFKERLNRGTVRVLSGGLDGTSIRTVTDLTSVLDDGDNLRVLAIIGKGSIQNIDDLLYLKGIDISIVQSDVLTFVKRQRTHPAIEEKICYITKLYNEELHLLANKNIATVSDLAGQPVNFGTRGSGTYMTASIVFETLGISVEPVSFDQALALEKVKSGEIAAMAYVAGKPVNLFRNLSTQENLHFLAIEYTPSLLETYLPSRFTHADYPKLIAEGEQAQTLAVGAVMAVYNLDPRTPRYRKVARFVETFFSRFDDFQQPPRHSKWREVNLATSVPGWTRFKPAENWLKSNVTSGSPPANTDLQTAFQTFLEEQPSSPTVQPLTNREKDKLFQQFMRWQNHQDPLVNATQNGVTSAEVEQLLARAERQLKRKLLTTPEGNNAYETYSKVLELDPDNRMAWEGLVRIADSYLTFAEQRNHSVKKRWHYIVSGLVVKPDHAGLLALREQLKPDAVKYFLQRGWGNARAYYWNAAINNFRRVLELDPQNEEGQRGLVSMANVLVRFPRNYKGAYEQYRYVLETNPHNEAARQGLQDVLAYYRRRLERTPDDAAIRAMLDEIEAALRAVTSAESSV